MVVVRHVKKGEKDLPEMSSVLDVLSAFNENIETAFVIINGQPATSDKRIKQGDKVLVIPAVSGG